jgi:hypothetical protein
VDTDLSTSSDPMDRLIEACQFALATFQRNGVIELSERIAVTKLREALEIVGVTPRNVLTTDDLVAHLTSRLVTNSGSVE